MTQHRKTLLGLLLAAALVAAATFLLPAEPQQGPVQGTSAAAVVDVDRPAEPAADGSAAYTGQNDAQGTALPEDGSYTSRDDVALYLVTYGHLPKNFITKQEARALGWPSGGREEYAPGKCIGGDVFGNYEGVLPDIPGRTYHECDIDTLGADSRGAKRLVFSDDGSIYYTMDHYETFTLLYGNDAEDAP